MQAVILAGGKGTRLAPYTTVLPKPLMPVGDRPILEIILLQLKKEGFDKITLAVGHLAGLIQAYFGDGSRLGMSLKYSLEESPLGTVGPLKSIVDPLDPDGFIVLNGDVLTDLSFKKFLQFHRDSQYPLSIAVAERNVFIDFGVVELKGDKIVGYSEKPSLTYWVSMGVYAFSQKALDFIPIGRKYDLPQLVLELIKKGEGVGAFRYRGFWLDIGREEDAKLAQRLYYEKIEPILRTKS